jgi:hypothetical protein
MKVFIINVGRGNSLWQDCLARSTVAVYEDEDTWPFLEAGDREGYIAYCLANKKTVAGIRPTRPVASRWFNYAGIISGSEGDLWIHREKEDLWWTISRPGTVEVVLQADPVRAKERVYVIHKQAAPWSSKSKKGNPFPWRGLHPKAGEFLFTESTLQQLSADNAAYAVALIEGTNLSAWHSHPSWKAKEETSKRGQVKSLNARERAVLEMAETAQATVAGANGQEVLRTIKNKELRFTPLAFEKYLKDLLESQNGLCAITGMQLQFRGEHDDPELICSLDRIDSDGHYEEGNLQIVCRFVNRWKSNQNNDEFRRLMELVRSTTGFD